MGWEYRVPPALAMQGSMRGIVGQCGQPECNVKVCGRIVQQGRDALSACREREGERKMACTGGG